MTMMLPGVVSAEPGTETIRLVDVCAVTDKGVDPNITDEPLMKLDPRIVIRNVSDPAVTLDGDNELMLGAGLGPTTGAVIVNVAEFDVAPPGFVTLTLTVPALPRVTVPPSSVVPRYSVLIGVPPKLILAPLTKFEPATTKPTVVKAVPLAGEMPLTVGAEAISCNVAVAVPPPGGGFMT